MQNKRAKKEGKARAKLPTTLDQAQGAQAGDVLSWEKLHSRLRPWLAAQLAGANLPPGMEIEDLVSEVFYKVCRDIAKFEVNPGASFRGWLLMIAERSRMDFWREFRAQKRGAGKGVQLTATGEVKIVDHREPRQSAVFRGKEALAFLEDALTKLTPKRRRVIELRLFEGLEFAEIARRMNYDKPGTVRVLYKKAREQLQVLMAPLRETGS